MRRLPALIMVICAALCATPETSAQPVISTVAGNGLSGFSGDAGPATSARLYYPSDVAVDSAGNVFLIDWNNNRIRRVTPDGIIATVAGNGTTGFDGDGGPAIAARLYLPRGLTVDAGGNL